MSVPTRQSPVSISAVAAAGLASATAALATSRFGVAGTLIGAALTTMIITGGSAILKAYLESVTGKVRKVPGKVRERASRIKEPEYPKGDNPPGRPDLRNNFMGRLRAALGWFSNLSTLRKRSIIVAALVPAVIAFIIGMGTVTGVELASGKSLSCSVWSNCPSTSVDGTSTSTRPSILLARPKADSTNAPQDQQQGVDPAQDQPQSVDPAQNQQVPSDSGAQPAQPANPQQDVAPDPATPDTPAAPAPEDPAVQEPTPQDPAAVPPEQQAPSDPPASETPAPEAAPSEP